MNPSGYRSVARCCPPVPPIEAGRTEWRRTSHAPDAFLRDAGRTGTGPAAPTRLSPDARVQPADPPLAERARVCAQVRRVRRVQRGSPPTGKRSCVEDQRFLQGVVVWDPAYQSEVGRRGASILSAAQDAK